MKTNETKLLQKWSMGEEDKTVNFWGHEVKVQAQGHTKMKLDLDTHLADASFSTRLIG